MWWGGLFFRPARALKGVGEFLFERVINAVENPVTYWRKSLTKSLFGQGFLGFKRGLA
jgi:predicted alpha/beta hydrolase